MEDITERAMKVAVAAAREAGKILVQGFARRHNQAEAARYQELLQKYAVREADAQNQ